MHSETQTPAICIDPATGLLDAVRQSPSPNQDARPADSQLDLIVVHSISLPPGVYGGHEIDALFCNELDAEAHPYFAGIAHLRVSAHCLIRRSGEVTQYVPIERRAWHAGESNFEGRTRCNDFSVGIELEGTDTDEFTSAQYRILNALIDALRASYPSLANAPVVGHSDIAPGRKTDPGTGFDWSRVHAIGARGG
ncbi:MAG: 1,6-anhydro-N-acetylmuramyl-L-alanine amidase AmpD [Pseudomonadota bacterium]